MKLNSRGERSPRAHEPELRNLAPIRPPTTGTYLCLGYNFQDYDKRLEFMEGARYGFRRQARRLSQKHGEDLRSNFVGSVEFDEKMLADKPSYSNPISLDPKMFWN